MLIKPPNHLPYPEAALRRNLFDAENERLIAAAVPVALAAIGDSLTQNWDLGGALPGAPGALVNRGIGGDTAWGVAGRFTADVLQLRPARALVLAGINDTWILDDPEATDDTPAVVAATILRALASIAAAAARAGQPLTLCTILPVNIPATTPGHPTNAPRNRLIAQVNAAIAGLAHDYSAALLDLHAAVVAVDGRSLRPELSGDGIHLNQRGYALLGAALRAHGEHQ